MLGAGQVGLEFQVRLEIGFIFSALALAIEHLLHELKSHRKTSDD